MNKRQIKKKTIKTIYPDGTRPIYIKNGVKVYTEDVPEKMWMFFFSEEYPYDTGPWSIDSDQWEGILNEGYLYTGDSYDPRDIFIITDRNLRVLAESVKGEQEYGGKHQISMNSMFATVGWRYVDLKYKTAFDHFENLQRWRNCQNLYGVYKQTPEEEFKAAGLEDVHDSIENTTSSYWSNDPEGCRRHNFFELLFERKYRNDSCELRKFLERKRSKL